MTKLLIAICVALAVSLGIAGCGGVKPKPRPSRGEIDPPVRSSADPQNEVDEAPPQKPVAAEPNDIETSASDALAAQREAPVQPQATPTQTNDEVSGEPNTPALPGTLPETEIVQSVPSQETVAVEPNPISVSQTQESEPNIATIVEPADPALSETEEATTVDIAPSEPDALASFHQGYAEILQKHIRKDGRVDYASLRRRRLRLKQLLNAPDELDPDVYQNWPKEKKLAFWINTYNLKMLEIIARNYPIQSSWWLRLTWPPSDIRHIGRIWSDYRFIVMDEEFTLGDVERRLFGRIFADPRAYLAITYAGRSSPSLRQTPYRGAELNLQLDAQVKAFLSSEQGFQIDREKGIVYLSALFKPSWRGKDFVGRYATDKKFKDRPVETRAVLNFLIQYISSEDIYFLEVENYTISYMNFDWRLNEGAKRH